MKLKRPLPLGEGYSVVEGLERGAQRENEIIPLLRDMKNARAVADELLIAQATAKSNMRSICQEFGAHSQAELGELANREEREPETLA